MYKTKYTFEPQNYKDQLISIITDLQNLQKINEKSLNKLIRKYPRDNMGVFRKDQLIAGIEYIFQNDLIDEFSKESKEILISKIKMKPTRTISGVTTVTVLTKPFACPGRCIFCPNDVRMPKSYIATEPGAQRALMHRFSPYLQVFNRLKALKNIGHPAEKIELLVLGGTWSYYTERYKVWFISECLRAMNDFGSNSFNTNDFELSIHDYLQHDYNDELREKLGDKPYNQLLQTAKFKNDFSKFISKEDLATPLDELWQNLESLQDENSKAKVRCVGLVLETRPDSITEKETYNLRRLGATKIQLGIQTLDDKISDLNKRGEYRIHTANAFNLLRTAGFKIHAHIMPNLLGANPKTDFKIYKELFESPDYKPDELKIYPTSVIKNTELYSEFLKGNYRPYDTNELINLIADCIEATPEYCRLTRIIRDIPSTEIESGNKTTNLREVAEYKLKSEGRKNLNIRSREIKDKKLNMSDLHLDVLEYETKVSKEYFLQYITKSREIAGFLRLSIPNSKENKITQELNGCALIREVHVYGPSLELSKNSKGEAQHLGLGTLLLNKAKEVSKEYGFSKLAVISGIGTREYYKKRGFELNNLYQIINL